ncbi:MAG: hypothetical protein Q9211_002979 [Gyalolechia sp. 1 TL-2023]
MSSDRSVLSGVDNEAEFEVSVGDNFIPDGSFKGDDPTPFLVYLTEPGEKISKSALRKFRADLGRDDVFRPEFCYNLIEPDALDELAAWHTKTQTFVLGNPAVKVAPGPYIYAEEKIWQPWRIYLTLDAPRAGTYGRVIVPSRCYYKPSKSRPIDGARISVKDNVDIAGHKTTLCNRAWMDLYPTKTKSAACVQVLLDAGAVIVCKVKLQAMIMREEPLECVEFTAPFNPRADGYQVPSGSSHGSAAGIGSYDWLDFSIGSDTQTPLIDKFVEGLESAFHVKRAEISLSECWKRDSPDGPEHTDVAEYLRLVCLSLQACENPAEFLVGWRLHLLPGFVLRAGSRDEYAKKYGRPPFVHKAMRWQCSMYVRRSRGEFDMIALTCDHMRQRETSKTTIKIFRKAQIQERKKAFSGRMHKRDTAFEGPNEWLHHQRHRHKVCELRTRAKVTDSVVRKFLLPSKQGLFLE